MRTLRPLNPLLRVTGTHIPHLHTKRFSQSSTSKAKALPPRPTLPESSLHEVFLRGSGPGGQKINKTASAVQLKHLPTGIVIKSQATRSRTQNRKIARRLLAEKIEEMEKGEGSRVAVKREREGKRKASAGKKARRKYRALESAKGPQGNGEGEEGEGEVGEAPEVSVESAVLEDVEGEEAPRGDISRQYAKKDKHGTNSWPSS
ncbi:MAG: hypothetical protein M1824_001265 [Vezdaea acicularis]|nr:MAG: hypothetical protein M1824_001265 [Vezdaea acicularis]